MVKWSWRGLALISLLSALAGTSSCSCPHRAVVPVKDDGWRSDGPFDDLPRDGATFDDGPVDGPADRFIPDQVNLAARDYIYVLDDTGVLRRFNPLTYQFGHIGKLTCPATGTPNSMAVDRHARAWVNYHDGNVVWVSTSDASCQASGYVVGQLGSLFDSFGMGFVADGPATHDEKLYVSEHWSGGTASGRLASIDPVTLKLQAVGLLPAAEMSPELTGTSAGALYGYFPGIKQSQVVRLDKTTAKAIKTWKLPGLGNTVNAWAFAHWGGHFFIFVTAGSTSRVLRFSTQTGKAVMVRNSLPFRTIGAGVSARAPLVTPDGGAPPP